MKFIFSSVFVLLFSFDVHAGRCQINDLHPTQFAVGYRAVADKKKKLEKARKNPDSWQKILLKNTIPWVKGPSGRMYMIDRHHFSFAMLQIGEGSAFCELKDDLSALSEGDFAQEMIRRGWVYLRNEQGDGPKRFEDLPGSVDQLRDDPYRSLAEDVQDEGGFCKSSVYFTELIWAQFFRENLSIPLSSDRWKEAVREGIRLARSSQASHLPGWDCQVSELLDKIMF